MGDTTKVYVDGVGTVIAKTHDLGTLLSVRTMDGDDLICVGADRVNLLTCLELLLSIFDGLPVDDMEGDPE